ncbi:NAD-dependent epimerase/dehydratase family protein [Gracilibacillus caseinilyticus]|uniref:NAD-dependent epimerase/dehydratase family protein n=1 Tax=Gracilibacillus caseinilyticus TaxID=2932256 RepID=A0ABY4EYA0_9BACI|nr:NAD-dependent epimerase/dehydratase family protein [Gracilibacillus caseinilyticus]UOQ48614.1 NAD-dependent epimerase/dehydratase family protein [Gracilibacillus caseinilyticus]
MDLIAVSNNKKLLITGANGFTGQHACSYFHKKGFDITAVSHSTSKQENQISWVRCNLTEQDQVKHLINSTKPDYVLHLAGQNDVSHSWKKPVQSIETNMLATLYLLEAIREVVPLCRIVVVGSTLQFNPLSKSTLKHPYGLSKTLQSLVAQSWVPLYNMEIIIANPTNLIGPGPSNGVCSIIAENLAKTESMNTPSPLEINLQAQRDFLDVRDAITAYHLLLLKGSAGEIYNVTTGKNRTLGEIVKHFQSMSSSDFHVGSKTTNQADIQPVVNPARLHELGWEPTISLKTSLSDTLHYYRRRNSSA